MANEPLVFPVVVRACNQDVTVAAVVTQSKHKMRRN